LICSDASRSWQESPKPLMQRFCAVRETIHGTAP